MQSLDPTIPPPSGDPQLVPPGDEAANDSDTSQQTCVFTFTGSGKEYFRIWIVNLLLTIVTLGIYSAWAKVRRLQYFDRNTQLAGASFDFDGDPKAILRGRVIAVGLLAAYQYAFGFSLAVGIGVVITLLVMLPFMMRGALRFRLRNTRYRGLRFNFSGTVKGAYLAYLPPLVMFLSPAALLALDPSGKLVVPIFALYLCFPLMHGAMKRYQHRHLEFGSLQTGFEVRKRSFYKPYLVALGLWVSMIIGMVLAMMIFAVLAGKGATKAPALFAFLPLLVGLVMAYLVYLIAGPYVQVRIGNLVWSNTSFPGIRFNSFLGARSFMKLQTINVVLTLLTLGLYRPFAVVRIYEYRLAHMTVDTDGNFEHIAAGVKGPSRAAGADGVADFLGVDLSW
ncbi:MAG: YjgN family protein [Telluria sp.]